jgi:uncharacterized membrane protein
MSRTPIRARLLLLTTLVLAGSAVPVAAQIPFASFDIPGAADLRAYGINDDGVIVGTWTPSQNAPPYLSIGFIRSPGGRVTTPILHPNDAESFTVLRAINEENVIAGFYGLSASALDASHGFVLTEGLFLPRDFPGAAVTAVRGINNRGDLSGTYGTTVDGPTIGFILPPIGPGISFGPPPGGSGLYVSHINDWRQVVGYYTAADGTTRGYLREPNGQMVDVIVPGAAVTLAYGINDCGIIVGLWTDGTGHGFYGHPGTLHSFDLPGAGGTAARGINNHGRIVGEYSANGARHGYVTGPIAAAACEDD